MRPLIPWHFCALVLSRLYDPKFLPHHCSAAVLIIIIAVSLCQGLGLSSAYWYSLLHGDAYISMLCFCICVQRKMVNLEEQSLRKRMNSAMSQYHGKILSHSMLCFRCHLQLVHSLSLTVIFPDVIQTPHTPLCSQVSLPQITYTNFKHV